MARPRQFDENAVLDAAMRCFWRRGYEATSTRDLARSMNITGASLYNAFGDKRSLYRRALEHYVNTGFVDRTKRFEAHLPPAGAIRAFFEEIVELSLSDEEHKGCLLVNSALELSPHDPEFQTAINAVLGQVEGFFRRCVAAGQRDGSIPDDRSPEELARFFLGILMGLRVLARTRPERPLLEGVLHPALSLLGDPSP